MSSPAKSICNQRHPVQLGRNRSAGRDPRAAPQARWRRSIGRRGNTSTSWRISPPARCSTSLRQSAPAITPAPRSGAWPSRGRYQRHRDHAVGPVSVRDGRCCGARRLEPEPRPSCRFGELPGVEKRGQPRGGQHGQKRGRLRHLGMLSYEQQLQRQPVARRAVIGPAPGE